MGEERSRDASSFGCAAGAGEALRRSARAVAAQDVTPAAGSTARTDIRYVLPFGPDGLNPGLTATATEEGVCGFASSAALDRPDAWDCISADDQIFDPCFENPFITPDEPGESPV